MSGVSTSSSPWVTTQATSGLMRWRSTLTGRGEGRGGEGGREGGAEVSRGRQAGRPPAGHGAKNVSRCCPGQVCVEPVGSKSAAFALTRLVVVRLLLPVDVQPVVEHLRYWRRLEGAGVSNSAHSAARQLSLRAGLVWTKPPCSFRLGASPAASPRR